MEYLKLAPGDRVVGMVNNLGATSILEMNIINKEIKDYLGNYFFMFDGQVTSFQLMLSGE